VCRGIKNTIKNAKIAGSRKINCLKKDCCKKCPSCPVLMLFKAINPIPVSKNEMMRILIVDSLNFCKNS
tara:strand:- start:290 stop:496 length:207 start_codon:yes stop_codon:yes gene_type:complete